VLSTAVPQPAGTAARGVDAGADPDPSSANSIQRAAAPKRVRDREGDRRCAPI